VAQRFAPMHVRTMRRLLLVVLLLAGCGSAKRTDGVTASEAAQLNAAAEKLDSQAENSAR
jgi:outer membrane murein-binding lipoprotein Lpp